MGYAKYVGRVGALAVALGIGAALVGSGPGVAWAQDEGNPDSQSQSSTPTGDPAPQAPGGNPGGGGTGDNQSGQPDVEVEQEQTGSTGLTTTTGGGSPEVTVSSSGGSLTSRVFRRLFGEAAPPARESQRAVVEQVEQPVAFQEEAAPMAMVAAAAPPATANDVGGCLYGCKRYAAEGVYPFIEGITVGRTDEDYARVTRNIYAALFGWLGIRSTPITAYEPNGSNGSLNAVEKMLFPDLRPYNKNDGGVIRARTDEEDKFLTRAVYNAMSPELFGPDVHVPATGDYKPRSMWNELFFHDSMHMPPHDPPTQAHADHMEHMAGLGMQPHEVTPIRPNNWMDLFAGPRNMHDDMMLTQRIYETMMPGVFTEMQPAMHGMPAMRVPSPLAQTLWQMETMDPEMNMNMNMGECEEGGMDMSGMAGMDMGCGSMDHSMTPMMLVTAQGEVQPSEAMGHAGHDMGSMPAGAMPSGHDMGSMPAEAMPGHDMGSMPAETMPPGHDMGSMPAEAMPGHDMGSMPAEAMPGHDMSNMPGGMPDMPGMPAGGHTEVKGLLPSQDGYTFTPENSDIGDGNFAFTIAGPDGAPVKDYTTLHDRDLHLIVASDDLQQYAHLHPMLDDNGRWFVKVPDEFSPGEYRAFADFDPDGTQSQLTLGIDLTKPGAPPAAKPLVPSNKDSVDGFDVSLDFTGTEATVTVRRNGEVVTTQPYLAAAGHLVALREGDLGYLHVHPMDTVPDGPVNFMVSLPSAGTYAMFFDFKVDNVVRTARFVVNQP